MSLKDSYSHVPRPHYNCNLHAIAYVCCVAFSSKSKISIKHTVALQHSNSQLHQRCLPKMTVSSDTFSNVKHFVVESGGLTAVRVFTLLVSNALLSGAVLAENLWGHLAPSASRGAASAEERGSRCRRHHRG